VRYRGEDLSDLVAYRRHFGAGLLLVAGRLAELSELGIDASEVGRRGQFEHRDTERREPLGQRRPVAGVIRDDDQVWPFRRDLLDIGAEVGELSARCLRRVVRVAVDSLDLGARADGVEHLGRSGRERHDRGGPLGNVHGAVGRGHADRERAAGRCVARTARRARARLRLRGSAAAGGRHEAGRERDGDEPARHNLSHHSSSGLPWRTKCVRCDSPEGSERAALPPRTGRRRWPGARAHPPAGGITVAGQRRIHTGFAVLSIIPRNPRDRRSLLHRRVPGHERTRRRARRRRADLITPDRRCGAYAVIRWPQPAGCEAGALPAAQSPGPEGAPPCRMPRSTASS
jgi:hypothetical protein